MQLHLLSLSISWIWRNTCTLLIILCFIHQTSAQYQPSSCFATYQAVLFNASSSTSNLPTIPQTMGYPFPLTWWNTYPNLTSSSYALSGLKMGDINIPFSFTATLSANPTGGIMTYIPDSVSSIVYAAFSIILISSCSGTIYMQQAILTPIILNNPVRGPNSEKFGILLPFSISNASDYAYGKFISSFSCNFYSTDTDQQISLMWDGLDVNLNNITFMIYSPTFPLQYALTSMTVTYILVQISTFNSKLMFYSQAFTGPLHTNTFTTNFGIPSVFIPTLTQKCIIGLVNVAFAAGGTRPSQVYFADSGTLASPNIYQLIITNMPVIFYQVFTIMECDIHSIVNSATSPSACNPCSNLMPHCLNCTSPSLCIGCAVGWFPVIGGCTNVSQCITVVKIFSNTKCTACFIGFILSNNSLCICPTGYWIIGGGCTNVSQCISVVQNYSTNTSTCSACSPGCILNNSICYQPAGYWIVTGGCTNVKKCLTVSHSHVNSSSMCISCQPGCILNNFVCQVPVGYWSIVEGCTNVSYCISLVQNVSTNTSTCTGCSPGFILNSNYLCVCPTNYWVVASYCTNIIGCITNAVVNGQVVCIFCNVIERYQLINSTCQCISGFYMDSDGQCLAICGDGKVFYEQCDDRNTVSGDGCSSICKIEHHYICFNGSQTHQSDCVYNGGDFSLTLKWIDKKNNENQGIFAFTVYPSFSSLNKLNLTTNLIFNCDQQSQFVEWAYSAGLLILYVDYQQNLQGNHANITIIFNQTFIIQKHFLLQFSMNSNGDKMIIVKDYGRLINLINFIIVLSLVVLFLFVVGSLSHKMIGVETLHTFQIIFLLQKFSSNFTPVFGLLRYFSIVSGNFLFLTNLKVNIYSSQQSIYYNPTNQDFSQGIIIGVSCFFVLCFLPLLWKWKQILDNPQTNNQFIKVDAYVKVIYTHFFFPIVIGFLMVNLLVVNTIIDNQMPLMFSDVPSLLSYFISLIMVLISSFVFFFEFKLLVVQRSYRTNLQSLPRCKSSYIPIYLIYIFLLNIVLVTCHQKYFASSIEIIAIIVFTFLIYMIYKRPYQSHLHNATQIMNMIMILFFVTWIIARQYFASVTQQDNQIFCMFLLCILMAVCLIMSTIRIFVELKAKCKRETKPQVTDKINVSAEDQLQQLDQQKKYISQMLNNFNPLCLSVVNRGEKIQQIMRINEQRLMLGADCLYSNKDIKAMLMQLPTVYRRRGKGNIEQVLCSDHK